MRQLLTLLILLSTSTIATAQTTHGPGTYILGELVIRVPAGSSMTIEKATVLAVPTVPGEPKPPKPPVVTTKEFTDKLIAWGKEIEASHESLTMVLESYRTVASQVSTFANKQAMLDAQHRNNGIFFRFSGSADGWNTWHEHLHDELRKLQDTGQLNTVDDQAKVWLVIVSALEEVRGNDKALFDNIDIPSVIQLVMALIEGKSFLELLPLILKLFGIGAVEAAAATAGGTGL